MPSLRTLSLCLCLCQCQCPYSWAVSISTPAPVSTTVPQPSHAIRRLDCVTAASRLTSSCGGGGGGGGGGGPLNISPFSSAPGAGWSRTAEGPAGRAASVEDVRAWAGGALDRDERPAESPTQHGTAPGWRETARHRDGERRHGTGTVRWKGSEGSKQTKHTTRKLTPC